jgi:hypothetical protein
MSKKSTVYFLININHAVSGFSASRVQFATPYCIDSCFCCQKFFFCIKMPKCYRAFENIFKGNTL